MRHDLRSVLTHGKGNRYPDAHRFQARILDDDGHPVLPSARYRRLEKGWCEGDNLRHNLVGRILASQVGRPWDAAHSALCRVLDAPLRDHLLSHAVEENCTLSAEGEVLCDRGRPVSGLYVDPRDGILRKAEGPGWAAGYRLRKRRRRVADPDLVPLTEADDPDRRVDLRRIEGAWYVMSWVRSEARLGDRWQDPVLAVRHGERVTVFETLHAKRQIARGEIRRAGLAAWAEGAARLAELIADGRDDAGLAAALTRLAKAAAPPFLRRDGPPAARR